MTGGREQLLILAELLVAENSCFFEQTFWWQGTTSHLVGITGGREQFLILVEFLVAGNSFSS
jgi:hypothetical protein